MKSFDRIYIELSNICNFSCPFCSGVKRENRVMTLQEIQNVLSQVGAYTDEVCLHVLGEPLLYPYLNEVFELCMQNKLKINLVTNGFYISDKLALIKEYSSLFKKISFSAHSYLYQTVNARQKLADIMSASIQLADMGISIEIRNLSDNMQPQFVACLKDAIYDITGVRLLDAVRNQKIKNKLFYVVKPPFVWPDKSKSFQANNFSKGKLYCLGGKTHIAILSDLTVVPCCLDCGGEIALGNIGDKTLSQILSAEKYIALRNCFNNGRPASQLCTTCKYSQR